MIYIYNSCLGQATAQIRISTTESFAISVIYVHPPAKNQIIWQVSKIQHGFSEGISMVYPTSRQFSFGKFGKIRQIWGYTIFRSHIMQDFSVDDQVPVVGGPLLKNNLYTANGMSPHLGIVREHLNQGRQPLLTTSKSSSNPPSNQHQQDLVVWNMLMIFPCSWEFHHPN